MESKHQLKQVWHLLKQSFNSMKNQLFFLALIISLLSCNKEKTAVTFSLKVDKVAKRYQALGRFSGTILIAQADKILFNQFYGLADYEKKIAFSDTTIFKIGTLTELFINRITDQLNIKKEDNLPFQKVIEAFCLQNGLKHTFYQKENTVIASGHLFHNYRGQGLELQKSPSHEQEQGFNNYGLKSTATDLLKFAQSLSEQTIQKSGYLDNDGFSYAFQKSEDLIIIILSNRRHPVAEEMATTIQAIYKNEGYELPLLRSPFRANINLYPDYIGTYEVNPNFSFEVITRNDSLFTVMGGQPTHLIPQSEQQFYYEAYDAAIRFRRDSKQVVTKAVLYDGFLKGNEVQKIK